MLDWVNLSTKSFPGCVGSVMCITARWMLVALLRNVPIVGQRFVKTSQLESITATTAGQQSPVMWRVDKSSVAVGNGKSKMPVESRRRGIGSLILVGWL